MRDETKALHFGYEKDSQKTMSVPIYQTTAYEYNDVNHAAELFSLEAEGNIYTRLGNPTTRIFEERITSLENGADSLAVASGMAAIFYAISNVVISGDNVIASTKLYGGTITLLTQTLKNFGIEVKFFDVHNPKELDNLIDNKTKAIIFESVANPALSVPDFENIVKVAQKTNVITIVDNTISTPFGIKPLEIGCDVVVHSASKYIVGNGSTIAGVLTESKSLKDKLNSPKYPQFSQPDESYHGIIYAQKFDAPFCARARLALLRDFGAVLSPFNSWLLIQGLETLGLRIERHSQNALKVAKFLKNNKNVKNVNYPFLEGDENFEFANKYLKYAGGIVSFEVESFEKAKDIASNLKIFSLVTNIGDSKSIVTHPASTTHQQLSSEELEKAGVPEGLIRLSIGLENVEDLIEDLQKAIEG
jgi:O-acetylhomoserine (thiol)-lyase